MIKTAKELCEENKARIATNRGEWVDSVVLEIIKKLSTDHKGKLVLHLQATFEPLVYAYDHGPYSGTTRKGPYVDNNKPREYKKNHLLELIKHNEDIVSRLVDLGYKVEFSTFEQFSHFEREPRYVFTPETRTFFGKVIPAHETITTFETKGINVNLDVITISACCGEE